MSFGNSEEIQLNLLLKKALGFNFTRTALVPGQQEGVQSNIYNEQIFSQPIPNTNILSGFGSDNTITDGSTSYEKASHPSYTYIKRYKTVGLDEVSGSEKLSWKPKV